MLRSLLLLYFIGNVFNANAQELKNITPYEDSIKSIIAQLPEVKSIDSFVRARRSNVPVEGVIIRLAERPSLHQPLYYVIEVGDYSQAAYDDHFSRWETFYYNPAMNEILINYTGSKPMTMAKYRKRKANGPSFGDRILSVFGTRCK